MKPAGFIRAETDADVATIAAITTAAFTGHPYSAGTEAAIVAGLRAAGALTISLVAERDGAVVGHVAVSPVSLPNAATGWYGLGPVSVRPDMQARGIGSALVEAALQRLGTLGAEGCVLVGNPAFYNRFGFSSHPGLVYPGVPDMYVLAKPLRGAAPTGAIAFHAAFAATP
ncbi:GNAT family N-acetyltransferase [Methyloraptor flagellatus]|uniref:N-acetyltransferase n=1 Tax=Methyloraptor flagellatus TaxID=3162530 RepID=A0AAU7XFR0_9HYPH